MKDMMSEMMEKFMGSMGSGEMMETMHEIMPKMMEHCLSSMSKEEREKMLNFCHTMLKDMEERFLKK